MKLLYYVLIGFLCQQSYAQDVWLQNFFSPNSGCELTNSELVNVLINNNSGSFIPANSITVRYSVDAGAPVSELLGVNLSSGASWNFTFGVPSDLSACGAHDLKVWVSYASDPNPLNDTLNWIVQNDCTIVPGVVNTDASVCEGMNGATLDLVGWMNGTIVDWQTSTDSGATWTGLGNSTISNAYLNIDTTTLYQVIFDGGFCPDDTSDFATITVQPFPSGGTISSSATHCIDNVSGTLTLSGASGAVIFWQYSENNGASWTTLANSTNSQGYLNLITDTWYRTSTDGAICPNVFSDTAVITIDPLTVPGTLGADTTVCEGSTVAMSLNGHTGGVLDWEYSENLVLWTPLGNTTSTYTSTPLTQTTYYRVHVQSGLCADMYSDTVMISVDPLPIGGTVNSSTTHCVTNGTGILNLSGFAGAINFWEFSDGVGPWNNSANNTTTESYTGLTSETWYRVQIEGGACPDVYSDTAVISIDQLTNAGTLGLNDTICIGSSISLQLQGYTGSILDWESSEDLLAWTPLAVTVEDYDTPPLIQSTYYRAHVQNGECPDFYSDTIMISIQDSVVGGNIDGSMALCVADASDTLILSNYTSTIITWEQSTNNGLTWTNAPSMNDSLIFSGMSDTTWYRVLIDGVVCPDMYSDTAIVTIWEDSYAGILVNDAVICDGESIDVQLVGSVGTTNVWESSEDVILWNVIDTDTLNQTISPITTTSYRVIVQNEGCPEDTSNLIVVTVNPLPIVDAGLDVTITEFDTIQLNGSTETSVLWSPSFNLSDSSISDPFAWPTTSTTYTYVVTTVEGCEASDMLTVTVIPFIEPSINIRNVVTANGDGFNDVWLITGIEDFPETEVHIFNIYGQEVYQNVDYQNDWGGSVNGNPLPNGTYHYIVRLKGAEEVIKGNLTLLGNE